MWRILVPPLPFFLFFLLSSFLSSFWAGQDVVKLILNIKRGRDENGSLSALNFALVFQVIPAP